MMSKQLLICFTTANQWPYTKQCLLSLQAAKLRIPHQVLIVDDASEDGTPQFCEDMGYQVIRKSKPAGVTDSWNRAYRAFVEGDYEFLVIANDDVLIPCGALERLIKPLSRFDLVGPMSSDFGAGHQPAQAFQKHYRCEVDESLPENYQPIQDFIAAQDPVEDCHELPYVNGFFLAFSRRILRYEYPDGNLFRPEYVNVRNEDELCERMIGGKGVCLNSFVYHFKGRSFEFHRHHGQLVYSRNLTWKQAQVRRRNLLTHYVSVAYSRVRSAKRSLVAKVRESLRSA